MYQVALCEDEEVFLESQKKICVGILEKNGINYHIDIFDGSESFLSSFLHTQKRYDLILLDIMMNGLNGMELAKKIREHDKEAAIIFITSSDDYARQGYDVNALHYLMKPLDGDVLERLILSDYKNKYHNRFLVFKSGTQSLRVSIKDIIRLETAGRRVAVTLFDETVYYPGKLTELLEELPKNQFVRCHQSFAVNMRNTKELTRNSAIAVNGLETPVGRVFTKDLQQAFLKYICED